MTYAKATFSSGRKCECRKTSMRDDGVAKIIVLSSRLGKTRGERERGYPPEGEREAIPFFHDRVHDLLDCATVPFDPLKHVFAAVYGSCRLPCFDYQTMQIAMFNEP